MLPQSWTRQTKFSSEDLRSENPIIKIKALRQFVKHNRLKEIPYIINMLQNNDDEAVANQANWALKEFAKNNGHPNEQLTKRLIAHKDSQQNFWLKWWKEKRPDLFTP